MAGVGGGLRLGPRSVEAAVTDGRLMLHFILAHQVPNFRPCLPLPMP